MNSQEFSENFKKIEIELNNKIDELIDLSKKFKEHNKNISTYELTKFSIDRKLDCFIEKIAWNYDILDNIDIFNKKSKTFKIRKSLGYNK